MSRITKDVLWSEVDGQKVALSQTYGADGEPQLVSEDTPMPIKGSVQLSGSNAILKGEAFPTGKQNDTLMEYDEDTGDTAVYKFISGAWREL
jgi:hypothetical protein